MLVSWRVFVEAKILLAKLQYFTNLQLRLFGAVEHLGKYIDISYNYRL